MTNKNKDNNVINNDSIELFNDWAKNYDRDVRESYLKDEYPFSGYFDVLNFIYRDVIKSSLNPKKSKILDIGFGSGILTKKLYDSGFNITGVDFSTEMTKDAREKMPMGKFLIHDFSKGIPEDLKGEKFNYIIMTYSIHHLKPRSQYMLLIGLNNLLAPEGKIYVGDVMTSSADAMLKEKTKYNFLWDKEEYYPIYDEYRGNIPFDITFNSMTSSSGIMEIFRRDLSFEVINHKNISIRESVKSDAPTFMEWWNDGELMDHAGFPHGLNISLEDTEATLDQTYRNGRVLTIEIDDRLCGEMSYSFPKKNIIEMGIKIADKSRQNKGYGKIILSLFLGQLFKKFSPKKIILDVRDTNLRARKVYGELGFKPVKFNKDVFKDQDGNYFNSIDCELDEKNLKVFR